MDGMQQVELKFDTAPPARVCLSVSQITAKVKGLLEGEVGEVWVRGEISGFKPSAAGHLYFSLKDSGAVLSCAMFRAGGRTKFEIRDGLEVMAHGKVSVYAPRGSYQLIVDHIEPMGHGALQLAFEQLKAKLQKEGLFEQARKKTIPAYPSRVAIITSPTGAALQDMLNVLGRRNAGISILVAPSIVQGDAAPPQIVRALQVVNQFNLADVIVVARGGGSIEDLWCFNDENVVRAVAASSIPVISAVGHEVDFTLCDFAADLRAPTPSAAAELVSKNRLELIEALNSSARRLSLAVSGKVGRVKSALLTLENRLISPSERLMRTRKLMGELELRMMHAVEGRLPLYRQMTDELHNKMVHASERLLLDRKRRFEILSGQLEALSPLKVLGRGYTLVQDAQSGSLVKSAKEAASGREVALVFQDGKTQARIL
ncbi:MAG: exodeoxyribonuclease VII large subunit [Bdellovibrionota bacterium]